ncbi:MAG: chemotaxis protein CheX [Planctomycetota bacterium]
MQVEHINPFITAVSNTFSMMVQTTADRGQLTLGDPQHRTHPISAIIGLSGRASGTVVINLSESVALAAASALLMEEVSEVNGDVLDAVGELVNMIAGQAKAELAEYELAISLPNVVTGEGHEVRFPSGTAPLCVPFNTEHGPLRLEVGFEPSAAPVAV